MKLIFFELNEVPWGVLDWFCRENPLSTLATIMPKCRQFETIAADKTHLSPWKTWPTVHRGVDDLTHLIHDFGQDLTEIDKSYPPILENLSVRHVSTAVFGSLHSYPPPKDIGEYAFYLPDPFARSDECHPPLLSKFQAFNLLLSRESARNVSKKIPYLAALEFLFNGRKLGIRAETLSDVLSHLLAEQMHPRRCTRRRTYQFVLSFDIYMRYLQLTKPAFRRFHQSRCLRYAQVLGGRIPRAVRKSGQGSRVDRAIQK